MMEKKDKNKDKVELIYLIKEYYDYGNEEIIEENDYEND